MFKEKIHLTGVISELKIQQYYTEMGYDVFAPIHNKTRTDFIAIRGKEIIRVQVKTAQRNMGYIQVRVEVNEKLYTKEECDVIAFVFGESIWIAPIEEIEGLKSVNLGKIDSCKYKPQKGYNPDLWKVSN